MDIDFEFKPNDLIYDSTDALKTTSYILVDEEMNPIQQSGATVVVTDQIYHLNAMEYLYYWNEARIRILKGQLAFQQAVINEIQEDLRQANEALAALETQAAKTRAQSSDGKTINPDTSLETRYLDLHEALISKTGDPTYNFDRAGGDDRHNFSQWEANRTRLKNFIDRRSADAQDATLDYQTILNRFNNSYEVMAKVQEKLDSLIKAQLRNF